MPSSYSVGASAQEIYNEVKRIEKEVKAFANDTSKDLEARKVATFKYDANIKNSFFIIAFCLFI